MRNHYKMAKHFDIEITDEEFTFTRKQDKIAAEAALDGIYVLRTSLPEQALERDDVVLRYKDLADVERFFAPSTPNSTCGPSATGWPTESAPTCSYACCPTTSAGT